MLFTQPGRHSVEQLGTAWKPIVQFLSQRDVDGLASCDIGCSVRTNEGMTRRAFSRPPNWNDSLPDLLEDYLGRLRAAGIGEIYDLEITTHPLRRGVLQITEIVFDKGARTPASANNRFSLRFRDHPFAYQIPLIEALLEQSSKGPGDAC